MKLFPTSAISLIDRYTIEHEPVPDIDLMERAASKLFEYFRDSGLSGNIYILCGSGNNGGDGLALARMLGSMPEKFNPSVYLFSFGKELSSSAAINLERLSAYKNIPVSRFSDSDNLPCFEKGSVVVDALFGSGLNRPLSGYPAEIVKQINWSGAKVFSIDIPSGLMGEDNRGNNPENIVRANCTLTFQFPKISFLFPENNLFVGDWKVLDIGLHRNALTTTPSSFHYFDETDCISRLRKRMKFSHKGTFGHALLIAGSYGKMGAAILASKACLRSGTGLLTVHVPHKTYPILQTAVPEAMCDIDDSDLMFTGVNNLGNYSAVGIGPAIGQKVNAQRGLRKLLNEIDVPFVVDADAINILGLNPDWIKDLPKNTILTPHPKEFERIAGSSECGYERMLKAVELSTVLKIIVIVKGAHTIIASPEGEVWFNSTGNPGMATAGSGDVLTGIILGILSQGYPSIDAALLGVYLHGLAGDIAKQQYGENSLIASDIIGNLGLAFKKFE
jgi:ADP-dependent NAD(P)H-hydrate dehydratase / NAD(P)H-hydrate epimerase